MIIYDADDPLVLDGTYDQEGYKPGERERIAKSKAYVNQLEEEQMAKKKPKSKGKPAARYHGKKTNGKTVWKGADSRRAAKQAAPRAKAPRSQSLPGMAQVRDAKMDEICESIGEGLDGINQYTEQVDEGKSAAMSRLHARGLSSYRHAGVRVSLIPGAEKVSVKRERDREVNVATTAGETVQSSGAAFTDHEGDGDLSQAEQQ